jgi:hypothetical protein
LSTALSFCVRHTALAVMFGMAAQAMAQTPAGCLNLRGADIERIEGRIDLESHPPDALHYVMGQESIGFGLARNVIEVAWRANGESLWHVQTMFDDVIDGASADGVSLYETAAGFGVSFRVCGFDAHDCQPRERHFVFDTSAQRFVGTDDDSIASLTNLCDSTFFAARQASAALRKSSTP